MLNQSSLFVVSGSGSQTDEFSFNESNVTCSPNFYLYNQTCLPICEEWKRFSDTESALVSGSAATASVVGILGGVAVIVGSIMRYKTM